MFNELGFIIGSCIIIFGDVLSDLMLILIDKGTDKIASIIVSNDLKKEEERKLKELESRVKIFIDGEEV